MSQSANLPPRSAGILDLRLWVGSSPWRLAPVWTLLAGLVLSGDWSFRPGNLARVLLALLLVEGLWGAIWGQMLVLSQVVFRGSWPITSTITPSWPYATTDAPLARLWRWLQGSEDGYLTRDVWIALVLAGAASVMLGRAAVLASVVVALLALAATAVYPLYPRLTRFLGALVTVALPWWLGMNLLTAGPTTWWPQPAQQAVWLLMAAFTLLAYAGEELAAGGSRAWLWAGHVALVAVLVLAEERTAAIATAATLVVPSVRVGRSDPGHVGRWHLLALVVAVAILRLG